MYTNTPKGRFQRRAIDSDLWLTVSIKDIRRDLEKFSFDLAGEYDKIISGETVRLGDNFYRFEAFERTVK